MRDNSGQKSTEEREAQVKFVVTQVCEFYGISQKRFYDKSRRPAVVLPRQMCMWISRNVFGIGYSEIARVLDKDHSTVIVGTRRVSTLLRTNAEIANKLDELVKYIDPRHKILEHTFKIVLKENEILNLPQIADEVMTLACDKKIPRVEITFKLLRGVPK